MKENNYLHSINNIKYKDFLYYILSGDDHYQTNNIIDMIIKKYKDLEYEIINLDFDKEYNILNNTSYSLFNNKLFLKLHFYKKIDFKKEQLLLNYLNLNINNRYLFILEKFDYQTRKMKFFTMIKNKSLYIKTSSIMNIEEYIKILKFEIIQMHKKMIFSDKFIINLAKNHEGNLLSAINIIRNIKFEKYNVIKNMEYTLIDLKNSLITNNLHRSIIILDALLKKQGVSPNNILWMIINETKKCMKMLINHNEKKILMNNINFFSIHYIFNKCFYIDLIIKGIKTDNIKTELIKLISYIHNSHD